MPEGKKLVPGGDEGEKMLSLNKEDKKGGQSGESVWGQDQNIHIDRKCLCRGPGEGH